MGQPDGQWLALFHFSREISLADFSASYSKKQELKRYRVRHKSSDSQGNDDEKLPPEGTELEDKMFPFVSSHQLH